MVKGPITLKRSVTESEGVASKPVLPPPPERRPRDGTRAPRVCRGDASAVSTGEQGGTRRPVGRVLSGHGRSSQGRDPALGRGAAGARRLCYIRLVHRHARWIVPRCPRPASVVTGHA